MFLLVVFIKFDHVNDMNVFIKEFNILKKYCDKNESNFLLQYEYGISDKEASKIIIVEKYLNKDYYINIHRKSSKFLNFKLNTASLKLSVSGESFII